MKGLNGAYVALVLASVAANVQAQHIERAYLSASVGASAVETPCIDDRYNCSLSGKGGRLLGGLFIGNGLSVEAVFIDFGRGKETRGSQSQQLSLRMAGIGTAVHLELGGGLAFVARGGLAGTRSQRDETSGPFVRTSQVSGIEGYVGFGGLLRLNRQLAIEANLDVLGLSDDSYRREGGLIGSLGLSLRF